MMNKYLVVTKHDGETNASMETEQWILSYLDMDDCFSYDEIHVYEVSNIYDVSKIGIFEELELYGAWHDFNNPLLLEVKRKDGTVVFSGMGTDH